MRHALFRKFTTFPNALLLYSKFIPITKLILVKKKKRNFPNARFLYYFENSPRWNFHVLKIDHSSCTLFRNSYNARHVGKITNGSFEKPLNLGNSNPVMNNASRKRAQTATPLSTLRPGNYTDDHVEISLEWPLHRHYAENSNFYAGHGVIDTWKRRRSCRITATISSLRKWLNEERVGRILPRPNYGPVAISATDEIRDWYSIKIRTGIDIDILPLVIDGIRDRGYGN